MGPRARSNLIRTILAAERNDVCRTYPDLYLRTANPPAHGLRNDRPKYPFYCTTGDRLTPSRKESGFGDFDLEAACDSRLHNALGLALVYFYQVLRLLTAVTFALKKSIFEICWPEPAGLHSAVDAHLYNVLVYISRLAERS